MPDVGVEPRSLIIRWGSGLVVFGQSYYRFFEITFYINMFAIIGTLHFPLN